MAIILVPYHLDEYLSEWDIPLPPGTAMTTVTTPMTEADIWQRLATLYGAAADPIQHAARAGDRVTVISGDCTTSLATMTGLQRADIDAGIVWFDAHGDVQTMETTTSGYIGGMPLRILVGYRPDLIATQLGLRALPETSAILVDARDLDPPEAEYLANAGIRHTSVADLTTELLPAGPLLLHLDLDVIDGSELPGLRYPVPDGPTAAAVLDAARLVLDTGRVTAVDIACTWYPGHHDPTGTRADLLAALTR